MCRSWSLAWQKVDVLCHDRVSFMAYLRTVPNTVHTHHTRQDVVTQQAAQQNAAEAAEAKAAADALRAELERVRAAAAGQLREAQARALGALGSVRGEGTRLAAELEAVRQEFRAYQALKVAPAAAPCIYGQIVVGNEGYCSICGAHD